MLKREQLKQKMNELSICVIVPTYNNDKTLRNVISGILENCNDVIVVNDGSTDNTESILEQFPSIHIIKNEHNKGKGTALYKAMHLAIGKGFKYAITIDSDGQHNPNDIALFVEKLEQTGEALIIGARDMDKDSVPGKSQFGRKFSNFWFKVETGINSPDTQSGYRLYPLNPIKKLKLFTKKFEFEIEIIVRLAWKNIKVESVPVSVIYFNKEERVSHFRPFKDFTRISILNTFLVTLAFLYFMPIMFFKKERLSELLYNKNESNFTKACSIAFGVFMGIIPIWGFQLIVAIALAFLLKLNKFLVIIFANISIPPMIPIIIFGSLVCGKIWTGNSMIPNVLTLNFEKIKPFLLQYIVGSITLAFIAAITSGIISYIILRLIRKETQQA